MFLNCHKDLNNPLGKMVIILWLFCEKKFSSPSLICQRFQTKLLIYFITRGPLESTSCYKDCVILDNFSFPFKVAHVVNLKLAFMACFFNNLIVLIKLCNCLLEFCTYFPLNNIYKRVFRGFFICLNLELLRVCKVCRNQVFLILEITQYLNKIITIPNTLL